MAARSSREATAPGAWLREGRERGLVQLAPYVMLEHNLLQLFPWANQLRTPPFCSCWPRSAGMTTLWTGRGRRAVEAWGPIERESPRFEFVETSYYDATMGPGLKKVFFAFQRPFDPGAAGRNQAGDQPLGGGICRRRAGKSRSRGR